MQQQKIDVCAHVGTPLQPSAVCIFLLLFSLAVLAGDSLSPVLLSFHLDGLFAVAGKVATGYVPS